MYNKCVRVFKTDAPISLPLKFYRCLCYGQYLLKELKGFLIWALSLTHLNGLLLPYLFFFFSLCIIYSIPWSSKNWFNRVHTSHIIWLIRLRFRDNEWMMWYFFFFFFFLIIHQTLLNWVLYIFCIKLTLGHAGHEINIWFRGIPVLYL